jgi:hypothetical protein
MAKISPFGRYRAFDDNGDPLAGGKLYTYEAGTTTNKQTFTTEAGDVANANPVILDADGYADVWLGTGAYKFVLTDASDVTLWTVDNISGEAEGAFGSAVITQATNLNVTSVFNNNAFICTAAITLSLLSATEAGDGFFISVKNDSGGNVIIDPDGAETIDGAATLTLADSQSCLVITNGTAWYALFLPPAVVIPDIPVKQVVYFKDTTTAVQSFTSSTLADVTNYKARITPSSASNDVQVTVTCATRLLVSPSTTASEAYFRLAVVRVDDPDGTPSSTDVFNGNTATWSYSNDASANTDEAYQMLSITFHDQPATTSEIEYKIQCSVDANAATATAQVIAQTALQPRILILEEVEVV